MHSAKYKTKSGRTSEVNIQGEYYNHCIHIENMWAWAINPLIPGWGTGPEKTRFPFWYNFLTKWLLVFILVFGTGLDFELYVFLTTGLLVSIPICGDGLWLSPHHPLRFLKGSTPQTRHSRGGMLGTFLTGDQFALDAHETQRSINISRNERVLYV